FKDGPEAVQTTQEQVAEYMQYGQGIYSSIATNCFGNFAMPYTVLKDVDEVYGDAEGSTAAKLSHYAREIQKRSTTRKADERICFATLLGLNPTSLLEVPDDQ